MDKGYWIFPSNAEDEFDAITYFKDNEKVDWRKNNKNKSAKKGDIVFIYVSKTQTKKYKSTLAIQTEIIEITSDKIWLKFNEFLKSPIPYTELKQYAGVKSNLQGAEPIKEMRHVDFILNYPESKTARQEAENTKESKMLKNNKILYGPPGTGKTYHTIDKALEILYAYGEIDSIPQERDEKKKIFDEFIEQGQISFVTFHQSYGYEDFVEGIKPRLSGENDESQISEKMEYEIKDGIFKQMCQKANKNYAKPYILIIDEINRGNISKILGELITLLEPSKRKGAKEALEVTLPYSQEPFSVPKNLYIIGTMNTADRSIALLDTALRRRFEFIEMLPNPSELEKISCGDGEIDLKELLKAMNNRIEFLLDRERTIGHAFLIDVKNLSDLKAVFKNKILPLLQEYFYDDYAKINAVLNDNGMLESKTISNMKISLSDEFVDSEKKVWKITDSSKWDIETFKAMYKNTESN